MNRRKIIMIFLMLISVCFSVLKAEKYEKGFYMTAYKMASNGSDKVLSKMQKAGFNKLVFDIKNMNGKIFTKVPDNTNLKNYDITPIINIPKTVKRAHSFQMEATARIVMFHNIYIAENFPELRPKLNNGEIWMENKRKGACWLDSSHPKVQHDLLKLIEHVASQGVDEIQMDYVRFPTQGNQKDVNFYFNRVDSVKAKQDSTYKIRKRYEIIGDFVKRASKICKKYDVKLTADVFAIVSWQRNVDINLTGQNLTVLSKYLDSLHPMVYSSHFAKNFGYREDVHNEPYQVVFKCAKLSKKYSDSDCKIIPYIQANSYRVNYKPEYMFAQTAAVKDSGSEGFILWDASSKYNRVSKWFINKGEKDE